MIEGGAKTRRALDLAIELYEESYGHRPPSLPGQIAWGNLDNFQLEYARRVARGVHPDQAAQEAIRSISFGQHRVDLGYDDFTIDMEISEFAPDIVTVDVDGVPVDVEIPYRVEIEARQ